MGVLDSFIKPFVKLMKQPVESFIRLETAEDETTLVAEDGSLITYLKVDGSRQIIGQKEYEHILDAATVKIGARFEKQGHAIQVFFSRNPDRIEDELRALLRPNQQAAHGIGLEIDDIFENHSQSVFLTELESLCFLLDGFSFLFYLKFLQLPYLFRPIF